MRGDVLLALVALYVHSKHCIGLCLWICMNINISQSQAWKTKYLGLGTQFCLLGEAIRNSLTFPAVL